MASRGPFPDELVGFSFFGCTSGVTGNLQSNGKKSGGPPSNRWRKLLRWNLEKRRKLLPCVLCGTAERCPCSC
ncbi:hypothetical protein M404DRAFT_992142 [Pisolithus tinctorius Marx 270]|uniref:Uncharacterized protein n=1 Tax=Pisolithus tinctorius Marx 270 TaxID=870435 RepID=A0A0C3PIG4_PISTI|nr:hypothetical protein M404DRAFT_992142 [Pisolithus tinctorius Marx 270]